MAPKAKAKGKGKGQRAMAPKAKAKGKGKGQSIMVYVPVEDEPADDDVALVSNMVEDLDGESRVAYMRWLDFNFPRFYQAVLHSLVDSMMREAQDANADNGNADNGNAEDGNADMDVESTTSRSSTESDLPTY